MSDKECLRRYREGDAEALHELVERYKRPLFGFIVNMTGGNEADEIFQEVWFKVIRKIDRYRDKNFMGWLMRIARNIVIDRARRKKPVFSLDEEREDGWSRSQTISSDVIDPAGNLQDGELGIRITQAVSELPAEQKEVFLMRMQAGISFKEIAKIQKVSINTALARMQYALSKLRPMLQTDYDELAV